MENLENSSSSGECSVLGKRSWNSSWSSSAPKKEKLIPLSEIESGLPRTVELRLIDRLSVDNRWVSSHLLKGRYLSVLNLEGTGITARSGKVIGKLAGLVDLNVSRTPFGNGLVYLKKLRYLTTLDIRSVGLGIDNIRFLVSVPSLKSLYLGGERDHEDYFHRIGCLTSLRKLNSLMVEVRGNDPGQLAQLTRLTSLHVLGIGKNRNFSVAAAQMTRLTELGLRNCGLIDEDMERVRELTGVSNLYLDSNRLLTTEGILRLSTLTNSYCVDLRGIKGLDQGRINEIFNIPPDYDSE